MSELHPLLARQLRAAARMGADGRADLDALIELVDQSYKDQDRDRRLSERANALMEEELHGANARAQARMQSLLNAIVAGIKEGVVVTTQSGQIVLANSCAEALFGLSSAQLAHMPLETLFQAVEGPNPVAAAGVIRGGALHVSGSCTPVEITASAIADGDARQTLWLIRDITEQLRWAAQQQENTRRTEDFARSSSDWFWQSNADHSVIETFGDAPPGAENYLRHGLSGSPDTDGLSVVLAERQRLNEALAARQAFREIQVCLSRDTAISWYAVSARPMVDPDGVFLGYRGSVRDISAAKAHEEELTSARKAADDANRLKSHFLATMSHELRTPMNAILGFSEVIRDQVFGPDQARYCDYAASIHQSGQHLLSLINDILDLSKIESGSYRLECQQFCLSRLADECFMMVRPQAAKGQVGIDAELGDAKVEILGDPRAMRQVIVNLLSNAVKFTPAGGRVRLSLSLEGGRAMLSVRDTGIGIAKDFLPFVFDPFRQQDSGLARKYEGTGLGLAITKRLVEQHCGTIAISSEQGVGTEVRVAVPLAAGQAGAVAAA
ncbi:MAG TPA: hypothetical protein DCL48_04740 [Alphaproteobacteria bacterium]|nr:hypothetical protein [Alphaproteobacteria bacterium]